MKRERKRTKSVIIWFTESEIASLKESVAKSGLSNQAEYIRLKLFGGTNGN